MAKTIKIIPFTHPSFDDVRVSNLENGYDSSRGFWLHGIIEDDVKTDYSRIVNISEIPNKLDSDGIIRNYLNGIFDVEVLGVDYPCVGYFWLTENDDCESICRIQRGLIVAEHDVESHYYAKQCYDRKATDL